MENNLEKHSGKIRRIIRNLNLLKISVDNIEMIKYNNIDRYYCVISIHGGLNGHGNWNLYLMQIQQLFTHFYLPEIIELTVDNADDVWDLKFSISGYEGSDL